MCLLIITVSDVDHWPLIVNKQYFQDYKFLNINLFLNGVSKQYNIFPTNMFFLMNSYFSFYVT